MMSYTIYYLALRMLCKGCYRISIVLGGFMWTGENDSNTIHVDAFFVFENRKKKIPIFGSIRIRVAWVSGSKSVVSLQLIVLNSGTRYMISGYSVENHKGSCFMTFLNPTIIAQTLPRQPCLEALGSDNVPLQSNGQSIQYTDTMI